MLTKYLLQNVLITYILYKVYLLFYAESCLLSEYRKINWILCFSLIVTSLDQNF